MNRRVAQLEAILATMVIEHDRDWTDRVGEAPDEAPEKCVTCLEPMNYWILPAMREGRAILARHVARDAKTKKQREGRVRKWAEDQAWVATQKATT